MKLFQYVTSVWPTKADIDKGKMPQIVETGELWANNTDSAKSNVLLDRKVKIDTKDKGRVEVAIRPFL